MVRAVEVYGFLESLPANDGGEVEVLFAVKRALDAALEIGCPAFVQPEVFPVAGRDEVARPGVREFVGWEC
jgi:hypothetical protein